jgi:hypothetical protein
VFVGLSTTFAKFGKFRLGAAFRITKKNAAYMCIILMFVWMFQLMWYMILLSFWMVYAVFYGLYWCIKKLVQAIKGNR